MVIIAAVLFYCFACLSIAEAVEEKDWPRDTIGWTAAFGAILAVVVFY